MAFDFLDSVITNLYVMINPDKLRHLQSADTGLQETRQVESRINL